MDVSQIVSRVWEYFQRKITRPMLTQCSVIERYEDGGKDTREIYLHQSMYIIHMFVVETYGIKSNLPCHAIDEFSPL